MASMMDRIKRLYNSGAIHITFGTFATKFVAFFGSIFVVRLLSKEDYGLLSYVENIYSYALVLAGFGLSYSLLRFAVLATDGRKKKSFFNYVVKNSLLRNLILLVIIFIVSRFVVFPSNYVGAATWLSVIAFLLPFQDLVNDDFFMLRALFKNRLYAYSALVVSVLLIVGRVVGAYFGGVGGVVWSRIIINFICGTIGFLFIERKLMPYKDLEVLTPFERKEVNIYSIQYMVTNGFWAIFMLNDALLLGILLNDPAGLADYKVACVLPSNISLFSTAIGVFVAPHFTKNEKNKDWVKKAFPKVFLVNFLIVLIASGLLVLLSRPLVSLIYGESYLNTVPLMILLTVAALINSGLRYTTANLLSAMGDVKYNMYISAAGIILQIVLDVIFIPLYGVMSVPIINCIVYFLMAICLFFIFGYKHLFIINAKTEEKV